MSWNEAKKQGTPSFKAICACGKEIDLHRNMWIHTSRYDHDDDEIRIKCEYCDKLYIFH